jgi:hypothetical protein
MLSLSRFVDCLGNRMLMHIFSSTGAGQVSLWEADSRNAFRNIKQKQRNIEITQRYRHLLRTTPTPSSSLLTMDYLRLPKTTSLLTRVLRPVLSLIG